MGKYNLNGVVINTEDITHNKDNSDYIDEVLENARDNIEEASLKNDIEEARSRADDSNDDKTTPKSDTSSGMSLVSKIMLGAIIVVAASQLIMFLVLPVMVYCIYTIISLLLVLVLSTLIREYAMVLTEVIMVAISCIILMGGFARGLSTDNWNNKRMTMFKVTNLNTCNPKKCKYKELDDATLNELNGKFIYYYKYGCPDCAAIDGPLHNFLKEKGYDVVCVETRSDFGKQLLKMYPVVEVPAGLIIFGDNYESRILYKKNNEESVIDMDALNVLVNFMDAGGQVE